MATVPEGIIQLREFQERDVKLDEAEIAFLLDRRDDLHIDTRPSRMGAESWQLKPASRCGIVPLPSGRTIYIEPKAPIGNVLHMLRYAYDAFKMREEPVGLQRIDELLEALVSIFAKRVELLITHGLLRSYQSRHENLLQMRGRLDVAGNIRHNLAGRHRLMCNFDEFTTDIPENRILRCTLYLVRRAAQWNVRTNQDLDYCERRMAEVDLVHITDDDFAELRFTRLNEHYRTPLNLARLLINMLSVSQRPGGRKAVPLLMDMEKVFEAFLQRLVEEYFAPTNVSVRFQKYSKRLDVNGIVELKPDIVLLREDAAVCIADAKYKLGAGAEENGEDTSKPANADIYQMLAYCIGYGVREAVLLYPEPRGRRPIVISRAGVEVCIHSLGIDLAGSHDQFQRQATALCDELADIVRSPIHVPH